MNARAIILGTILLAWTFKIVLILVLHGPWQEMTTPAVGGYYPWSLSSTEAGFDQVAIAYWALGEWTVLMLLALAAYLTRARWLALTCAGLWLGSIVVGMARFCFRWG